MSQAPEKIDSEGYYSHDQSRLLELVNVRVDSVLEIGCATGNFLQHYLDNGAGRVTGVEYVPEIAEYARLRCPSANVLVGSIDCISDEHLGKDYDLIIVSFVLEHISDPWKTLSRLYEHLKPGGQLVGSLPNVRHVSVTLPLLFYGRWKYQSEGILDRTHFRFFTRSTIEDMLNECGFSDIHLIPYVSGGKSGMANKLTFRMFEDVFAFAYGFSAIKI